EAKPPTDLREGWNLLKQGIHLLHARPEHVKEAPCQEVVQRFAEHPTLNVQHPTSNAQRSTLNDFTLHDLPIIKCWPKDGGRFITLANVHTRDPETGARNVGIYRMQVYDRHTTGMHWQLHKVGARHGKRYYERGERMPVAVTLGGDPVYTFAATAPLPDGLDELLFAGFLRRKSVELVRCKTIDLEVPADVDFVLEGYVQPGEMRPEGPFGDHTGFYTAIEDYPVFHLTAITHRRDAICPTTIVGKPPMEDYYIGEACDVHNTSEVLFRLCANTDPGRDTTIIKNPSDSLDHAPSKQNIGSHMGFDATRKLPGENYHRPWPELLKMTDEVRALVDTLQ